MVLVNQNQSGASMKIQNNFPFLLLALITLACGSGETDQSEQTPVVSDRIESTACYAAIVGKDTLSLRMEVLGNVIKGKLSYNFFEKDDNEGTIRGEMHGDTLIANYIYNSEGVESVRQVAFLQMGDIFVEGYGDMKSQDGKVIFQNNSSLNFNWGMVFEKVSCE